jgi:hypothetical protein
VKPVRKGPTILVQLRVGLRSPNKTVTPAGTTTIHMVKGTTCIDNTSDTSSMAMSKTFRCRHRERASALEQTRDEKLCQTPKDSGRDSVLKLRGVLPTGREALRSSEPRHSHDKAMPSYYTKNESFVSGIFKMWCVCVLTFTMRWVFIGANRTPADLDKLVWCQVVVGRPSRVAD